MCPSFLTQKEAGSHLQAIQYMSSVFADGHIGYLVVPTVTQRPLATFPGPPWVVLTGFEPGRTRQVTDIPAPCREARIGPRPSGS